MIKRILAAALAISIMALPALSFAEDWQEYKCMNDRVSISVPHEYGEREGIAKDYTGTSKESLRMKQIFLIFKKESVYMNLDYIADNGGQEYDLSSEKSAMKMYKSYGFNILQEDLVSSGAATTGEFEEPEYFEAANGIPYIKQALKADGSDEINMICYLTCSDKTVFKMFVVYGMLDKATELYGPIDPYDLEDIESIIGTYEDTGYDQVFLSGEEERSPFYHAGKYAVIGLIVGGVFFGLYFLAKQTGRMKRGEKTMLYGDKGKEEVVVRSVRDSYADRGKNPNAKKGKNHGKKDQM